MFKKSLLLLFSLMIVLGLAACDEMEAESAESEEVIAEKEKEKEEKELAKLEKKEAKAAEKEEKKKIKEEKKLAKEKEKEEKERMKLEEKELEKKEKEKATAEKKVKDDEEAEQKEEERLTNRPIDEMLVEDNSAIQKATLEDGTLKIEMDGDGSFSINTMVSHPATSALEAMELAFKDEKVETVAAIVKGTLIDDKGNESKEDIVSIYYDKNGFEELDYENFRKMALAEPWRVYNESFSYFIHPAIYKDLKEKFTENLPDGNSKVDFPD